MAKEVFHIEFKFPIEPAGEWTSFSAKARESFLPDTWEIYSVLSDNGTKAPFQTLFLKKEFNSWKDRDSNQETLLAALIGRAIDNAKNRGR